MENNFDFDSIGKRTPYRVPDGLFDTMSNNVLQRIGSEATSAPVQAHAAPRTKPRRTRRLLVWAAAAAAVVALLMTFHRYAEPEPKADYAAVEQAFGNLSDADQAFLLAVYTDDVFDMEQ